MDCVCCSHVVPTLTLESIHTHTPGVGNLDRLPLREYLDCPGEYGSSVDDLLRSWLAGKGRDRPSWRALRYAVLRSGGCHGWEDTMKFCAPEGMPNYIPIAATYTVVLYG